MEWWGGGARVGAYVVNLNKEESKRVCVCALCVYLFLYMYKRDAEKLNRALI